MVGGRRFRPSVAVTIGRGVEYADTIRPVGRKAESVVGCEQVFFVLMDAAVSACTFPRSSVVVNYNQLFSEMKNVSACFFMMLPRECNVLYYKTVDQRSGSLEISCRQENSRLVTTFQCSRMPCTVAHLLLLVSSFSARGSGTDYLDVVSENTPSWHGLCLSCMVVASAAILLC